MTQIKQKLKEKKAFAQSTDFIIFFSIAVILVVILIELTINVFSIYTMNIVANNVARTVSVCGEIDNVKSEEIYDTAAKQLGKRIETGSLEIRFHTESENTSYYHYDDLLLTSDSKAGQYGVNLGDEFTVHASAQVVLFHVGGKAVKTTLSATSSGVGEVYFKSE